MDYDMFDDSAEEIADASSDDAFDYESSDGDFEVDYAAQDITEKRGMPPLIKFGLIGFAGLLVIAALLYWLSGKFGENKTVVPSEPTSVQAIQPEIASTPVNEPTTAKKAMPETTEQKLTQDAATAQSEPTQETTIPQWVETSLGSFEYSGEATLDFTVTSVISYAKVLAEDEVQLRTVVRGTIGGYTKVYEVEVPLNLASRLVRGNVFSVTADVYTANGIYALENIRA